MFTLTFSNRPEVLLERLTDALSGSGDPFLPAQVLVPSTAMRRRIELSLADAHGICANVRFDYLAQWLWARIGSLVTVSERSPFAPAVLTWRIYEILGAQDWCAQHPRLQAYLAQADGVMRLEIAQRIAQLFDHYTTYRSEWLARWSDGQACGMAWTDPALVDDERWQAELWRRLEAGIGVTGPHPASRFLGELAQGVRPPDLPSEVHVFGLPAIAPLHLGILQGLSRFIDVRYYALNPCEHYWFDLVDPKRHRWLRARHRDGHQEVGHPLLAGWGRQTQAHVGLVFDMPDAESLVVDDSGFMAHRTDTLLGRLQQSIFALQPLQPGEANGLLSDRSIELHCCHSLTRELEVVHDRLLALFAADPSLEPAQVVVLVPDLERAAPLIDAVFGTAPADRRIPFSITGQPARRINRVARVLSDLIATVTGRLGATELMGLLEQAPVAARFGLSAPELDTLRSWARSAGIRWGADAGHRMSLGLPQDGRHTLDDGLQRLFLSYAAGEAGDPVAERLPAGNPEGQAALALGRFWRFARALLAHRDDWATPRSADEWRIALDAAIDTFIDVSTDLLDELRAVQVAIGQMHTAMRDAALRSTLPIDVLQRALTDALDETARGGVPGGLVTFASLSSLRGLSWRVVCLLGLDDGVFPSTQPPAEFDLIAAAPRAGDRQRAQDDRNLFLDLLLSARERLHLSHTGRHLRDNAEMPPSVLVCELLDHLALSCARTPDDPASVQAARRQLIVHHPLQAFSAQYFVSGNLPGLPAADPRLAGFDTEYCEALKARFDRLARSADTDSTALHRAGWTAADHAAGTLAPSCGGAAHGAGSMPEDILDGDGSGTIGEPADEEERVLDPQPPFFTTPLPTPGVEWREVELASLQAFLRNPCRTLLVERLGLQLSDAAQALEDDEPFVLDYRARSAIAHRLLPMLLAGADLPALRPLAAAGIELPSGTMGTAVLEHELGRLHAFAQRLGPALAAPTRPALSHVVTVDIEGERWTLHGALTDLRDMGLVRWRYDEARASDRLEAWLLHLFACAAQAHDRAHRTEWHARDGVFAFTHCADADALLGDLLRRYRQGLSEPLRFFPRAAWAHVTEGPRAARQAWEGTHPRWQGESDHAAYRLAMRGVDSPLDDRFVEQAQAILTPLLAHLEHDPS